MNIERETMRRLGLGVIILHALVIPPHSIAHSALYISMEIWQNIFIFLVILAAPILAAILLWKRHSAAFAVLGVSMTAAFLFGVYYHFLAIGSDNVFLLPGGAWTVIFQISALLLALTELAGGVIGLLGFLHR